jgi:hypothetical protein
MKLLAYMNPATRELVWVDPQTNKTYQLNPELKGLHGSFFDWLKNTGKAVVETVTTVVQTGQNGQQVQAQYPAAPAANTTGSQTTNPNIIVVRPGAQAQTGMPSWLLPAGLAVLAIIAMKKL